ncbi:ribonuclease z [Vairimorpha ceranae]|uniref:Ribonuclease z n=1 Tax=Vairimorpha ceranae TaxID=40302 RepID=A0A0F9WSB5_9MICR|nr:ribonuclease z [Vairimorpha ceranae]KKO75768.1 ribonuclease z [Vairimorpha ceranae]
MKRLTKSKELEENKKKEREFKEITSQFIQQERQKMEERISDSLDKMFDDEVKEIKIYKEFDTDFQYKNPFKINNTNVEDDLKFITKL